MAKIGLVKEQFASVADFYGELYYDDSPKAHLFSTRLKRVMELLNGVNGEAVLDVGCGPGIVASLLLAKYGNYFGIDLVEEMLLDCRARHQDADNFYLGVGNLNKLPFPEAAFDVILCLGAIEYVEDPNTSIQEFSRVVREQGTAVISMQNKRCPYRIWDRHVYHGRVFNTAKKMLGREPTGLLLENPIELSEFQSLLARNGFKVRDVVYYDFNLWIPPLDGYFPKQSVGISRKLEFLCRSRLRGLGTGYIIKATKLPR